MGRQWRHVHLSPQPRALFRSLFQSQFSGFLHLKEVIITSARECAAKEYAGLGTLQGGSFRGTDAANGIEPYCSVSNGAS